MFHLRVLGGAVLQANGAPVTGRAAQPYHLAVLAILAAAPGRTVSRDKVVGLLWADSGGSKARHRLSVALHVVRKELGDEAVLTSGDSLTLNPAAVWTDVDEFVSAVADGRLEEAVDLYRGPFLDGFFLSGAADFERWVDSERDRLSGFYRAALERLINEAEAAGTPAEATAWWRRLAIHDPYSAPVAVGLMRALAAEGDLAGAIGHARAHAILLQTELELPADPRVLELAEALARTAERKKEKAGNEEEASAADLDSDSVGDSAGEEGRPTVGNDLSGALARRASAGSDSPARRGPDGKRNAPRKSPGPAGVVGILATVGVLATGGGLMLSGDEPRSGPESTRSVAVSSFRGSGLGPDHSTLGEDLAQDVRATLRFVPDLRVSPGDRRSPATAGRASARRDRSGSHHLIEGEIHPEGDDLRIDVRLRAADSGDVTWRASYLRSPGDEAALREELSLTIADALRLRVAPYVPKSYTENRRAYDRFLLGVYAMRQITPEDLWQALQFHREAWEEDPEFALAHAIAGNAYIHLSGRGVAPQIAYERAREHVLEALALDSTLAEGHAALGNIQTFWDRDFEAGERSLRKAIMLYPTLPQARTWYGFSMLYRGRRPETAVEQVRTALEVDPLNTGRSRDVERILYLTRRYEEVIDQNRVTWSLDTAVAGSIRGSPVAQAYRELGRYEESVGEYLALMERTGVAPPAGLALTYIGMGRESEALTILGNREAQAEAGQGSLVALARIYAALGDADRAIERLERALLQTPQPTSLLVLGVEPAFDPLRSDHRFQAILRRLGLPVGHRLDPGEAEEWERPEEDPSSRAIPAGGGVEQESP